MTRMRWSTRFIAQKRVARQFRTGRVFLAGDAAHVFSPFLGVGMNIGIQDAMNLGWKLAAEINGWAHPGLLASYQEERLPVANSAARMTGAMQRLVVTPPAVVRPLRRVLWPLVMSNPRLRGPLERQVSGLATRYRPHRTDLTHRWVGQRAEDVTVGSTRLYEYLRAGKFVLLDRTADGEAARIAQEGWSQRLTAVRGPTATLVEWPEIALIRPDGYFAWAGDAEQNTAGAMDAIRYWCGAITSSCRTPRSGRAG